MREVLVEYIRTSFDMSNDEYINRLEPIVRAARPERLQKVLFNYFPKDAIGFLVDPSADIACANSLYQVDPWEIVTGVNLFADWLEHTVNYPLPHIKAILETIGSFLKMGKNLFPSAPYIFCLTAEEDKPYFWRTFAGDGGYAVGLDTAKLNASINAICEREVKSGVKPHRIMYLMPTLYASSNAKEILSYFELLYDRERRAFDSYAEGPPNNPPTDILSQILIAASVIKDEDFAIEREWRLVLVSTLADVQEARRSFSLSQASGAEHPKPRLKTGIFNECAKDLHDIIRCIWVSPQGNKAALHAKVQKQLGLLLSPMSGKEIAKDGLPFIRDSALCASQFALI